MKNWQRRLVLNTILGILVSSAALIGCSKSESPAPSREGAAGITDSAGNPK